MQGMGAHESCSHDGNIGNEIGTSKIGESDTRIIVNRSAC